MNQYGKLIIHRHERVEPSGDAVHLTAEWEGEPTILISDQFLEFLLPEFVERDGDIVTILDYKMRLVGRYDIQTWIAERILE